MHINSDFVVLEEEKIDGDSPRPLLLTSLKNWSMPFIRYRNEDCGYLSSESCSCGNNFPLMRLEIARTSDNFIFPDGRVIHGEYFTHLMYGSEGIANFQFHQTAADQICLLIVPGHGDASVRKENIRTAVEQIQSLSPRHPIRVEVKEVDTIPLSSAAKHRFTRSDLSHQIASSREPVTTLH